MQSRAKDYQNSPNKAIKKANMAYQSKKRPLGNGKVYAPPQGKYSTKLDRIGKLQTLCNEDWKILEWSRQKRRSMGANSELLDK